MVSLDRLNEFRQARFGMFIHWGIYSLLEEGEWVMYGRRIPVKEYEKLAARFNPAEFDAEKWVLTAKDAGMKYIVITAKHHDGFSMFKTNVSGFNIVDATPFGRDPMKELAEACRRHGMKLGFYYSHVREWRHPMAQSFECQGRPDILGNYGNFWDYPNENIKDLQKYIDEFDIPQLKELLTQYGDVFTIWFDTPSMIQPSQAEKIRDAVYAEQSECLVNGRISSQIESDYATMGDCEVPACGVARPWDTPMTMGHCWGYVKGDLSRPAAELIRELCDVASKGGNYLLNVGPTSLGVIPETYTNELKKMGAWLRENGEAVFGTQPSGLMYRPKWGCATRRGNKLYACVFDQTAAEIRIAGLKSTVLSCSLPGGEVGFAKDGDVLTVSLGGKGDNVRVVTITCGGDVIITDKLMPGEDGSIELNCVDASVNIASPYSKPVVSGGVTARWFDPMDTVSWSFITTEPNSTYSVRLIAAAGGFWNLEDFGHEVAVYIDSTPFGLTLTEEALGKAENNRRVITAGEITLSAAGPHTAEIRPVKICRDKMVGLKVYGLALVRKP